MPVFKIHHTTKYEYDRPIKESTNEVKVYPYICHSQEILHHELIITGDPDVHTYTDYWGNRVGLFNLLPPHRQLVVESQLVVRTTASQQLNINFHGGWELLHHEVNNELHLLELSMPAAIECQDKILEIVNALQPATKSVAAFVEHCSEYVFKHFQYIKGITNIETTVDEILQHRAGVCQDFAHLMLQVLRTQKVPGRYVSGYICPNKNGMRGEGATHAWVEAYLPGYGWAGIDPTNNVWVTNNHVKLSVGKHFNDCSPVKGTFKGPARQRLSVYVSVGYEDGHTFEDMNNVQMHLDEGAAPQYLHEDELEGQQQQ